MNAETKDGYTIENEKYQAFLNFLEVITNYSSYHEEFLDSYFHHKREQLENYYDGSTEMIEQFDIKDLYLITITTENCGEVYISDKEKQLFDNAINYTKVYHLDLKKDFLCILSMNINHVYPIINAKIETSLVIKAISQEYLEMSHSDYDEYVKQTASDVFTNKLINICLFFSDPNSSFSIPSFRYKITECE